MNKKVSFSIWYVLLAIMAVVIVHDFIHALNKIEELPYSEFKRLVDAGKVAEVSVASQVLTGKLKPEGESKEQQAFATVRVEDPDLVRELNRHGVT
ncbi:MAG: cell division protein FtsH, partial [Nitrospira sp. LK265]|nr:cell division protein FtsH [Nitrospira sp. LK265]